MHLFINSDLLPPPPSLLRLLLHPFINCCISVLLFSSLFPQVLPRVLHLFSIHFLFGIEKAELALVLFSKEEAAQTVDSRDNPPKHSFTSQMEQLYPWAYWFLPPDPWILLTIACSDCCLTNGMSCDFCDSTLEFSVNDLMFWGGLASVNSDTASRALSHK